MNGWLRTLLRAKVASRKPRSRGSPVSYQTRAAMSPIHCDKSFPFNLPRPLLPPKRVKRREPSAADPDCFRFSGQPINIIPKGLSNPFAADSSWAFGRLPDREKAGGPLDPDTWQDPSGSIYHSG